LNDFKNSCWNETLFPHGVIAVLYTVIIKFQESAFVTMDVQMSLSSISSSLQLLKIRTQLTCHRKEHFGSQKRQTKKNIYGGAVSLDQLNMSTNGRLKYFQHGKVYE
jgi:hypothetical protein